MDKVDQRIDENLTRKPKFQIPNVATTQIEVD